MRRAKLKDGPPSTEMVVPLLLLQLIKLLPFGIVQFVAEQDILSGGRGGDDFRATPHGEWLVVVVFVSQSLMGRALVVNVDGPIVVAPPNVPCASTGAILAGLLASTKYARLHVVAAVALLLPAATGDKHSDESSHQKEGQQGANHSSCNHAGIGWVRWGLCRREDRKGRERQERFRKDKRKQQERKRRS